MRSPSGAAPDIAALVSGAADRIGLVLSSEALSRAGAYIGLLTKWNRRLNLTSLPLEPLTHEAIDRLLIEPFLAAGHIRSSDDRAIDVGSGGGSPAIPMKILAPWLQMTLVESRWKKASFLREIVRELGLDGVEVENVRFEELVPRRAVTPASLVSIRAVRADAALWPDLWSVLGPGGRVFWFRSSTGAGQPKGVVNESSSAEVGEAADLVGAVRIERHVLLPARHSELVTLSKPA